MNLKNATYHPGFAAEIVDGEKRIDAVDTTILEANDKAAKVLS